MKHLLLTTLLTTTLGVTAVQAQTDSSTPETGTNQTGTTQDGTAGSGTATTGAETPSTAMIEAPMIEPPEGFERQDLALTAEDVLGATLYDATGDAIGDVHDLVLDKTALGGSAPAMSDGAAGSTAEAPTGTPAAPATPAPDAGAEATAPDGSGSDMAGDANSGATSAETGAATGTTDPALAPQGMGKPGADQLESVGKATHAVLDIGGFLGIGEHRVAVPIADLQIYRSDSETRVYLPWTRDQLNALPTFIENDPSTLGRSTLPVQN
ncbi:MAG: hypothetical protein JNN06_07330 [Gemmobacter sp.]|uniref:hypothetical protein n=1 Tax=Gemmobacter sp. TaxID=1898957 RepID=UPI001A5F1D07|nr:hypothetical protein [Gemmobacter sp.]MBL8562078.1 hypothetical protein [Gemmobacter sp.]